MHSSRLDGAWAVPVASTSRSVVTLPYRAPQAQLTEGNSHGHNNRSQNNALSADGAARPRQSARGRDDIDTTSAKARLHQQQQQAFDFFDSSHQSWIQPYTRAWSATAQRIQSTLSTVHHGSLDEITAFANHCARRGSRPSLAESLTAGSLLAVGLLIGANPGASALLFSSLTRHLVLPHHQDQTTANSAPPSLVSRISSRDCVSLKSALRSVISGFMGRPKFDDSDEEDAEGEAVVSSGLKSATLPADDVRNLCVWYAHKYRNTQQMRPGLVVMIEDLEGIDAPVMTSLFEVLHSCASKVPLTFLIGVATSSDALYHAIPRTCANLLDVTEFFVDLGLSAFNGLMASISFAWDPPVVLGPQIQDTLLHIFDESHHSIDATISAMQLAYAHQFRTQPAAVLGDETGFDQDDFDDVVEMLLALPSVAQAGPAFVAKVEESADSAWAAIEGARIAKKGWHMRRRLAWELVEAVLEVWTPRRTRSVQERWSLLERGTLLEEAAADWEKLILRSSAEKIERWIEISLGRLEAISADNTETGQQLLNAKYRLDELVRQLCSSGDGRQNFVNSNVAGMEAVHGLTASASIDIEFSSFTKAMATLFSDMLKNACESFKSIPLHEIWYVDDPGPLKRTRPAYLPCVHRCLSGPETRAAGPPKRASRRDVDQSAIDLSDDLATAYKLYQETGRSINLADWFTAFDATARAEEATTIRRKRRRVGQEDLDSDSSDHDAEEEDEEASDPRRRIQARFLRVVGDLAHVGFLNPTSRKSEHVLKNIF
ncbi:BZ3500_MvSof-1268-A1-R1_Chr4-2g07202 [Microbotryum saponariae]|uniref:BZ3500_MvSof-1268-A1-R1_Chr4-2g07202 protein n=1 Tax=Microbotryum saponariae TaxID=289078 RepID=A0A2X0MT17_9BASI|nr:BZ3500_MvSof-1268-A1-R1_Chr4-2g07202 [Microbotryum saponariae]SDA06867.1 BZ3501_MvSof-1269-A2-R1_Chr4-2g06913 [Microbotryum saponariae]